MHFYMVGKMTIRDDETLVDWLQQHAPGTLSFQDVAHLIRQAADALQYAHDQGIIYRDVTFSSFLIHNNAEHPHLPDLQLAEFGQAKRTAGSSSMNPAIPSNPLYMAPEQWSGTLVPASDQYALAVMAYELLTGHPPFQGTQEQLKYQHLHVHPQPPSRLDPHIPPAIDTVILHALAKNPEDRFLSISRFANAFQQALQTPGPIPTTDTPKAPGIGSTREVLTTANASISNSTNLRQTAPASNSSGERANLNRLSGSSQIKEVLVLGAVFLVVVSSIGFGFYSIVKSNQVATANLVATTQIAASATRQTPTLTNNTLIFSDPLTNNTSGHWVQAATCMFRDASYHVLVLNKPNWYDFCLLRDITFDNVAVQVDVSLLSGNDAGLFFRYNNTKWYDFEIDQYGNFILLRYDATVGAIALLPLTRSNAIAIGSHKNTLLVVANGVDIKLYINSIFVGEVHDNNNANGLLGFVAGTSKMQTTGDASFANLKVFRV
jgi:eukaryotic-like serine/threonine-protein kinase